VVDVAAFQLCEETRGGLWIVGLIAFRYAPLGPVRAMFSSFVAVLDIALVFTIFKGDVRLI